MKAGFEGMVDVKIPCGLTIVDNNLVTFLSTLLLFSRLGTRLHSGAKIESQKLCIWPEMKEKLLAL